MCGLLVPQACFKKLQQPFDTYQHLTGRYTVVSRKSGHIQPLVNRGKYVGRICSVMRCDFLQCILPLAPDEAG
ncbi:hypothetical protein D9M71_787440 [compost metagenome]